MTERSNPAQNEALDELCNEKVLLELNEVKQQVNSLLVQMASAMKANIEAEKQIEASCVKAQFCERYIEDLKKEIEETKIEQVLVDLNRLNVESEIRELEARRESEAVDYTQSRNELHKELNLKKDVKQKLAATVSDLNVLQSEMELIRAMDRSFPETNTRTVAKKHEMEDSNSFNSLLESTKAELEEANKILGKLKGESFQLMNEMDTQRKELAFISEEQNNSSKMMKLCEAKLSSLNFKLAKAIMNVESASMSEVRAQSIVSNLYAAHEQLKYEVDAAKRDTEIIAEETEAIREQTRKMALHTASVQEKIEAAMIELEAVKETEAWELQKLSSVTENAMSERAIASLFSPTVTISKFEYLYLTQQGKAAQEVADLKVAAAKAWLKAFEAEKDARGAGKQMKWAVVPYEEKKLSSQTKRIVSKKQRGNLLIGYPKRQKSIQLIEYKEDEGDVESSKMKLAIAMPRRSVTVIGLAGESERLGRRTSFSSSPQPPPSPARVKQAMGNMMKLLKNRRDRNKL